MHDLPSGRLGRASLAVALIPCALAAIVVFCAMAVRRHIWGRRR